MAKPWENKSGCKDPTAFQATKNISEEEQRVADLVWVIKAIARWAGFEIITGLSSETAPAEGPTDRRRNE